MCLHAVLSHKKRTLPRRHYTGAFEVDLAQIILILYWLRRLRQSATSASRSPAHLHASLDSHAPPEVGSSRPLLLHASSKSRSRGPRRTASNICSSQVASCNADDVMMWAGWSGPNISQRTQAESPTQRALAKLSGTCLAQRQQHNQCASWDGADK